MLKTMFTVFFFVSGYLLSKSFGIELKDNVVTMQSIVEEIKTLKTTHRAETDQLMAYVLALQEENRDLRANVQQLLQDRDLHKKICDEEKDGKKEVVDADHVVPNSVDPFKELSHPGIGLHRRQIPADGRVAFTAVLSNKIPHLGSHQTAIFDSVVTNIGNAYHPNSGIFVAPYKGAYVFNVKVKVPPQQKLHLELVVDGKVAFDLGVEIPNSIDYESANEEFIIEVNQGADVFVRSDATGGVLYGYGRSVFSGFLLFETE